MSSSLSAYGSGRGFGSSYSSLSAYGSSSSSSSSSSSLDVADSSRAGTVLERRALSSLSTTMDMLSENQGLRKAELEKLVKEVNKIKDRLLEYGNKLMEETTSTDRVPPPEKVDAFQFMKLTSEALLSGLKEANTLNDAAVVKFNQSQLAEAEATFTTLYKIRKQHLDLISKQLEIAEKNEQFKLEQRIKEQSHEYEMRAKEQELVIKHELGLVQVEDGKAKIDIMKAESTQKIETDKAKIARDDRRVELEYQEKLHEIDSDASTERYKSDNEKQARIAEAGTSKCLVM